MKNTFNCPKCNRDIIKVKVALMPVEPDLDEVKSHGVWVYACPHSDCGVILGVVPEPIAYLEDAVSAAQDAYAAADDAGLVARRILADKKSQPKKA